MSQEKANSKLLKSLYEADAFPVFQNRMYATAAEARNCPKGDIRLVEDQETGLVYNAAFRSELMDYDENYQNEQAISPSFRSHLEEVSDIVDSTLGRAGIIEIGCGKAYFMEMLLSKGFDVIGFDPTYEGINPRVYKQNFSPIGGSRAHGLILRHVLEHIPEPVSFLQKLKEANGGGGKIYIEVPNFDWICERRAWFDVFYEHANYFRPVDLQRMFGKVYSTGLLFGQQYVYVVADLASLQVPTIDPTDSVNFPADFTRSLGDSNRGATQSMTAIWGGASKGVIFALLRERIGAPVSLVIDVNPGKQDQYLPGTGLRVCSPAEGLSLLARGSTIFVMNSNYLSEIKQMSDNAYRYIGIDNE